MTGENSSVICDFFIRMANGIIRKPKFDRKMDDPDNAKGDAIFNCYRAVHKFDIKNRSKNPFGYFHTIIYNSFIKHMKDEVKHHAIGKIMKIDGAYYGNDEEGMAAEFDDRNYCDKIRGNQLRQEYQKRAPGRDKIIIEVLLCLALFSSPQAIPARK